MILNLARTLACVFALVISSSEVMLAQNNDFNWTESLLNPNPALKNATSLKLVQNSRGGTLVVRVTEEGLVGKDRPDSNGGVFGNRQAKFMEDFALVDVANGDKTQEVMSGYCLVAKVNPKTGLVGWKDLFGWIPRPLLLRSPKALPVRPGSSLLRKIRFVYSLQAVQDLDKAAKSGLQTDDMFNSVVYRSLWKREGNQVRVNPANIFFVFGEAHFDKSGRLVVENQEVDSDKIEVGDRHFLIGTADRFQEDGSGNLETDIVKGWVPANRVSEWSSRMAFEWNSDSADAKWCENFKPEPLPDRRKEPGIVFSIYTKDSEGNFIFDNAASLAAAKQYAKNRLQVNNGSRTKESEYVEQHKGMFENYPEDGKPEEFEDSDFRMPSLLDSASTQALLTDTEKLEFRGTRLYKVGWEGSDASAQRKELKEINEKLDQLKSKFTTIEIVFVIDGTESMASAYPEVALSCVKTIMTMLGSKGVASLRTSICFYGSGTDSINAQALEQIVKNDGENAISTEEMTFLKSFVDAKDHDARRRLVTAKIKNLQSSPLVKMLDRLLNTKAPQDNILHEDVFEGIKRSISKSDMANSSSNATQIVVVLGDSGDITFYRGDDDEKAAAVRRVIAAIWPAQCKDRRLFAVQFVDPNQSESEHPKSYSDFENAFAQIAAAGNLSLEDLYLRELKPNKSVRAEGTDELSRIVQEEFDSLLKRQVRLSEQIENLQSGDFHTKLTDEFRRQVGEELMLKIEKINKEPPPIYAEGYVWDHTWEERDGTIVSYPLLRARALMDEEQVGLFRENIVEFTGGEGAISAIIDSIIEEISNQKSTKTIGELWNLRFDLELNSGLFGMTVENLNDFLTEYNTLKQNKNRNKEQQDEFLNKNAMVKSFFESAARLHDIQSGFEYSSYEVNDDTYGNFKVQRNGNRSYRDRWFAIPGTQSRWIWLRLDKDLPR